MSASKYDFLWERYAEMGLAERENERRSGVICSAQVEGWYVAQEDHDGGDGEVRFNFVPDAFVACII